MSGQDPERAPEQSRLDVSLRTHVTWTNTPDVHHPLSAVVDGQAWVLRLGDFPAEPLYTLVVDGDEIGSFDTWPASWTRPTA